VEDGDVTFRHPGAGLGDDPPLDQVVAALDDAIGNRFRPV